MEANSPLHLPFPSPQFQSPSPLLFPSPSPFSPFSFPYAPPLLLRLEVWVRAQPGRQKHCDAFLSHLVKLSSDILLFFTRPISIEMFAYWQLCIMRNRYRAVLQPQPITKPVNITSRPAIAGSPRCKNITAKNVQQHRSIIWRWRRQIIWVFYVTTGMFVFNAKLCST